jgi:DNA-binding protein HU-beta
MTRRDQIDAIARVAGITAAQARVALDAVSGLIRTGLIEDERFVIADIGTLRVQRRRPRNFRNPRTGLVMALPASATVDFKATADLRAQIQKHHA